MNKHSLSEYGIRKRGIYICFQDFFYKNSRYPDNPKELLTVTSSVIDEKNFLKYKEWFLELIGDSDAK